jgi:hypothetical protein
VKFPRALTVGLLLAVVGCSFSTSTQTQAGIKTQQTLATAIADYTALVNRFCKEGKLTPSECQSQYERIASFVAAAAEVRSKAQ